MPFRVSLLILATTAGLSLAKAAGYVLLIPPLASPVKAPLSSSGPFLVSSLPSAALVLGSLLPGTLLISFANGAALLACCPRDGLCNLELRLIGAP